MEMEVAVGEHVEAEMGVVVVEGEGVGVRG